MLTARVSAFAIAALVAGATVAHAGPDPDHARLVATVGTYDVEMTLWMKPGADPIALKATSTIQPLFDGSFIEEQLSGSFLGTSFATRSWTGFNTSSKQYEATRIASTGTHRIAEAGTYDDKTKRLELKGDYVQDGDTWHERTVIEAPTPDSILATSYLSFGKVPEWKAVQLKYKRKAK